MNEYLAIRNWKRFQHYKDRRPPWIKFYVDWLEDYELAGLKTSTRLLACHLLLVAAKQQNKIPNDPRWIAERVSMSCKEVTLGIEELLAIRYLRASKPLALARSREAEVERDKTKGLNGSRPEGQSPDFQIPEKLLKDVS